MNQHPKLIEKNNNNLSQNMDYTDNDEHAL
jgi:hypothetical protein